MKRHINFREPIVWRLATLMLIGLLGFSSISLAKGGKWRKKADMPTPRTSLSCSAPVVNGEIYVIGGALNFWTAFPTVEIYDPATDKWMEKADMPTARRALSTSEVNGKIYAIGGSTAGNVVLSTVEEYTPEGWPFAVSPQGKLAATWGEIKQSSLGK